MDVRSQLCGAWRVDRIVTGGVEERKDEGDKQFLWFTDAVITTGNADAAWDMPYVLVADGSPAKIDITRNDRWESWAEKAIIRVDGEKLQLCLAGYGPNARPEYFESSAANGWTLYVATRCDEPLPR